MGIILFLVDTSASMNQKTYLGASYLDVAKVAIETFMKYRAREAASRHDKYMLVSFEEPPHCIKAGWKANNSVFISQLKNLQATSLSAFNRSLKEAFDLLNLHRLHTGIDHYGQGRIPMFMECAVVIAITDGGKLTQNNCVDRELSIVGDSMIQEGSELTNQPFRWDQRLFTVLLRLPGIGEDRNTPGDVTLDNNYRLEEDALTNISELTGGTAAALRMAPDSQFEAWSGGRLYVVSNQKSMVQCMEALTLKLQPGVVINFQKIRGNSPLNEEQEPMEVNGYPQDGKLLSSISAEDGPKSTPPPKSASSTTWHNTRRMIYVKSGNTQPVWPLPESFWPDNHPVTLPSRNVHPIVWFDTSDVAPMLVEKFPFDKYELEPSPLTQYILARRNTNICWQVFIKNSGSQGGLSHPFGYLKASSNLTHVTLFVMPYNYPVLLPLAEDLLNNRLRPSSHWRQKMVEYIATVPCYYAQPLRKAFHMMGAPAVVPESFDGQISYSISNYLRNLKKQAKQESERIVLTHSKLAETVKRSSNIVDLGDGITLAIGSTLKEDGLTCRSFRNPYDISRRGLLGQLSQMRSSFLRASSTTPKYIDEAMRHQVPIGQMGNYQEHLKKINPLRELDESGGLRTQLFGNPYKLERSTDKQEGIADEHMVDTSRKANARGVGRKKTSRSRFSRSTTPPPLSPSTSSINSNSSSSSNTNTATTTTSGGVTTTTTTLASSLTTSNTPSLNAKVSIHKADKAKDDALSKEPANHPGQVAASQSTGKSDSLKPDKDVSLHPPPPPPPSSISSSISIPEPFRSSSLPEEKSNHHGLSTSLNRKRERSPSPTTLLNSKRSSLQTDGIPSRGSNSVSNLLVSHGGITGKAPSPTPNSILGGVSGVGKGSKDGLLGVASSASRVLNEEITRQENGKLKIVIIREVRKPGQSYDTLFQNLENVRGSLEYRESFVGDIIKEAGRFKRKKLVQQLEEWKTNLKTSSHLNNNKKNKLTPSPATGKR